MTIAQYQTTRRAASGGGCAASPKTPRPSSTSISHLFAMRCGLAATRDDLSAQADRAPSHAMEVAFERALEAVLDADRQILALNPATLDELAAQAAVVLDSDFDFISADAKLVFGRICAFAGIGGRA